MAELATPRRKDGGIDYDFRPSDLEEMKACLADPMWRICSGALYKIIIKEEEEP